MTRRGFLAALAACAGSRSRPLPAPAPLPVSGVAIAHARMNSLVAELQDNWNRLLSMEAEAIRLAPRLPAWAVYRMDPIPLWPTPRMGDRIEITRLG